MSNPTAIIDALCNQWAQEACAQAWSLVHAQIEETECVTLANQIIAARALETAEMRTEELRSTLNTLTTVLIAPELETAWRARATAAWMADKRLRRVVADLRKVGATSSANAVARVRKSVQGAQRYAEHVADRLARKSGP